MSPPFASPGLRRSVTVPIRRMKFEKSMVRVKGAVQPVRKAMAYGGDATGMNQGGQVKLKRFAEIRSVIGCTEDNMHALTTAIRQGEHKENRNWMKAKIATVSFETFESDLTNRRG